MIKTLYSNDITLEEAQELVRNGADVNEVDNYSSCLFNGLKRRDIGIIKFLIENKADLNIKDRYGCTALHYCAGYHLTDIAEMLINGGANINALNDNGSTILDVALCFNSCKESKSFIKLLKKNKAKNLKYI